MFKLLISLLVVLNSLVLSAQTYVSTDNTRKMNDFVYTVVSGYKVIWMGEMHGARQPAEITEGFVNLLLKHKRKVTLALEIPAGKIQDNDTSSLSRSEFFTSEVYKNRGTASWFELISKFKGNKNVSLIYFDDESAANDQKRDSLMAVNLMNGWKKNTTLVVLSGNLHNMLEPRNGGKKAALFLTEIAKGRLAKNEVLSLTHRFVKGQILTSYINQPVKLTSYDLSGQAWAAEEMYAKDHLYIFPNVQNGWSGHFFTKMVEPAVPFR